ncbi:MAG: PIG-L family deacetylase [Anaerolineae bacterium]|nr:PIG-L family deacetylase [Anaerolineae bacterium]
MNSSFTILTIFAHPDDEIGAGSTLAYYSDKGAHTVLVCATRGEVATIFCDDCATRENLAQVRTGELECACSHIGIRELRWLDWPDGGVKDLPRREAVGQIVRQIRELRPDVIITHPEHGLYPHPDHLAIWEMVREAFSLAADAAEYPDAGPAWAPARLFTRALPQSIFEKSPGLADFRVELNGELLPFYATPDDEVDVIMHVEPWVERRMAAWECHRSQHNPKGFSATMPDGVRREMAANEHYLLAAARVPLPDGVTDDLLAGLAKAPEGPQVLHGLAESAAALRAELTVHLALADVCQAYLRNGTEPKQLATYRHLADGEQEIIHRMAQFLRIAGEPAGAIEADAKVSSKGRHQESALDRLSFLLSAFERSMARCQARVKAAATSDQRAVWEELGQAAEAQVTVTRTAMT